MKYQLFEKEIYADDDVMYFGGAYDNGFMEPVNAHFPDSNETELGDVIFESTNLDEVEAVKKTLEIQRMRVMNEGLPMFLFNDSSNDLNTQFFESGNFEQLVVLFEEEFDYELIRTNRLFVIEIGGDGFWIPQTASDALIEKIQALLGIYFYEIKGTEK